MEPRNVNPKETSIEQEKMRDNELSTTRRDDERFKVGVIGARLAGLTFACEVKDQLGDAVDERSTKHRDRLVAALVTRIASILQAMQTVQSPPHRKQRVELLLGFEAILINCSNNALIQKLFHYHEQLMILSTRAVIGVV